jgi:pyrroline-5-carboxylate reductase
MSKIVFIGGGRITSAMLAGLRLSKTKHTLVVHDRHPEKLRALRKSYGAISESDLVRAVQQADILLLAVRPSSIRETVQSLGPLNRPILVVSLAAGVPLSSLRKMTASSVRWARAMPSPVCRSGRGLTALTFSRQLSQADRKRVHELFASFGQVVEIPESKFDAFTVTYSCSHGYHALITLANAAQSVGLDRKTALLASAHALADGIVAWREGTHALDDLFEEAVTPGGIAAATANAMDASGYKRSVKWGIAAGLRRARQNARK